jgi:hypothetical protein
MRARGSNRRHLYLLASAVALLSALLAGAANWPRG